MSSKRNSIEIRITYDKEKNKYTFDSKLKAIFNKAKKAFQIKLPSGKYLLVKPEKLSQGVDDITGIDDRSITDIEPNTPPVRINLPRSPARRNSLVGNNSLTAK